MWPYRREGVVGHLAHQGRGGPSGGDPARVASTLRWEEILDRLHEELLGGRLGYPPTVEVVESVIERIAREDVARGMTTIRDTLGVSPPSKGKMQTPEDPTLRRDAELLYEVGTLRHVARAWVQFGNDQQLANVAEHTLRVLWLALVLARHEGADEARVVQLALVHDLAETRTGDVNYVTRMYVDRHEEEAIHDAVNGSVLESLVTDLWREYRAQGTLEARVVKDADNLDCDLELMESASRGLELRTTLDDTRRRVLDQLRTPTARKVFHQIYATDPHRWHLGTRNRLTAGDWSEVVVPAPSTGDLT